MMILQQQVADADVIAWGFRALVTILLAVTAHFLKRTGTVLDKCVADIAKINIDIIPALATRVSLVELLVEQHDKELDRVGLEKLVRRRYAAEERTSGDGDD
jgi:hypothetical protein